MSSNPYQCVLFLGFFALGSTEGLFKLLALRETMAAEMPSLLAFRYRQLAPSSASQR
jgi:hypothetical protein